MDVRRGGYTRYAESGGRIWGSVVAGWFVENMIFVFLFVIFFILVVF